METPLFRRSPLWTVPQPLERKACILSLFPFDTPFHNSMREAGQEFCRLSPEESVEGPGRWGVHEGRSVRRPVASPSYCPLLVPRLIKFGFSLGSLDRARRPGCLQLRASLPQFHSLRIRGSLSVLHCARRDPLHFQSNGSPGTLIITTTSRLAWLTPIARVERAHSDRAGSASTKDGQAAPYTPHLECAMREQRRHPGRPAP